MSRKRTAPPSPRSRRQYGAGRNTPASLSRARARSLSVLAQGCLLPVTVIGPVVRGQRPYTPPNLRGRRCCVPTRPAATPRSSQPARSNACQDRRAHASCVPVAPPSSTNTAGGPICFWAAPSHTRGKREIPPLLAARSHHFITVQRPVAHFIPTSPTRGPFVAAFPPPGRRALPPRRSPGATTLSRPRRVLPQPRPWL